MDISIFEVTGPVMIGPSSSHTAGAARLARTARLIVNKPFTHVSFGLHGSFARTYRGHGTDRALVAGALGIGEDDERLVDAFALAEKAGIGYDFYEIDLDDMHENSVKMTFADADGAASEVIGSSIGGAQIVIRRINGFDTEFSAQLNTLVICQRDKPGVVKAVSAILAENEINIGVMRLSRRARGDIACCVIETDHRIPQNVVGELEQIPNVNSVQAINIEEENADV